MWPSMCPTAPNWEATRGLQIENKNHEIEIFEQKRERKRKFSLGSKCACYYCQCVMFARVIDIPLTKFKGRDQKCSMLDDSACPILNNLITRFVGSCSQQSAVYLCVAAGAPAG